jgi:hypothetical protein
MKKLAFVAVLGVILAASGVFADHPGGLGIGAVTYFEYAGTLGAGGGAGVSLKVPAAPIFWALGFDFGNYAYGFTLTADYYFVEAPILADKHLSWYLGAGGFLGMRFKNYNGNTAWSYEFHEGFTHFNIGARVPVGLSWQPVEKLEVFFALVPGVGLGIYNWDYYYISPGGEEVSYEPEDPPLKKVGLHWKAGAELGVRYWF